jgi:hypothetical protein
MAAIKKKVNTANFSAKTLENIGSRKPELSAVGAAISANGGRTKKLVYK